MGEAYELELNLFQKLFAGADKFFGEHTYIWDDSSVKQGKPEDNRGESNKLLTIKEYRSHIEGRLGLGIVPLNAENKVLFSVIDVDLYNVDFSIHIRAIEEREFPIVPFRSKSGGLHLYTFYKNPVNASEAISISRKFASFLSLDVLMKRHNEIRPIEIFPKQTKLKEGGKGNWINLPYYNASETRTPALYKGKELSFSEALSYCQKKQRTVSQINEFLADLPFNDAPYCLQRLYILNNLEDSDGRNNFMFAVATYLKKKNPQFYESMVIDVNSSLKNPLSSNELEQTVLSSHRKKDYGYSCLKPPMCDYCDEAICRTREYGVGKQDGYFSELDFGGLIKYGIDEPYYEWKVRRIGSDDYHILRFTDENQIIKQDMFLKLCMRELHFLPVKLKQIEWTRMVNTALSDMQTLEIELEHNISSVGLFKLFFARFLLDRSMAETREQVKTGRVFYDVVKKLYYFKPKFFGSYLFLDCKFNKFRVNEVNGLLKDLGCKGDIIRDEHNKQIRAFSISEKNISKKVRVDNPTGYTVDFSALEESDEDERPIEGDFKKDVYE